MGWRGRPRAAHSRQRAKGRMRAALRAIAGI
jgi:hypothetical protein